MRINSSRSLYLRPIILLSVVLLLDLLLGWLGTLFPVFDTATWGTFGDWASAIVPAIAIIASVDVWRFERDERNRAARANELARITVDPPSEHPRYIRNPLPHTLHVSLVDGVPYPRTLRPRSDLLLTMNSTGDLEVVDWEGDRWELRDGVRPKRLGT